MVEWKPLYKLVKSISTGLNPRQNFILNEEDASLYYVTVKEITTNKVIFSDSTDRITENAKQIINNRSKLSKGDILFSGIGTIGKVAYVDIPTSNWDCSESVFLIKPNELETKGKYLAYILSSDIAKNQYERGAAGAIMKGVRKATLESLLIPIPSLPEQQRIVEQLDTFTNSIENLKQQIAQRRKQYEYYRDQLLDLASKRFPMVTLKDVAIIKNGKDYKNLSEGNIPVYGTGGIMTYVDCFFSNKPSVLLPRKGSVENIYYVEEAFWTVDTLYWTDIDDNKIMPKFLFLSLKRYNLKDYAYGGARPSLSQPILYGLEIPLPPLDEQQRIVSILDTFEASIQNLEAQLKEREKQYEYYRNKLLTFE